MLDLSAASRLMARNPETEPLEHALDRREMDYLGGLPIADHDIRAALHYRADQLGDIRTAILVVAIGVDDDVRPQP